MFVIVCFVLLIVSETVLLCSLGWLKSVVILLPQPPESWEVCATTPSSLMAVHLRVA